MKLFETATHVLIEGSKEELRQLIDEFAYKPNGYWYAPSYERWVISKGKEGWDGFLRPISRIAWNGAKALRGHKTDIINWARDNGYEIDSDKLLPLPFKHITIDDIPPNLISGKFELDDHQRRCILLLLKQAVGVVQVVVSGGKTAMFSGAAAFIKQHYPDSCILYLTPSERLVSQSACELRKMLPQMDIGQFGGGHHQQDAKDIVVCTVAMLNRHFYALKIAKWFKRFMAVFYDECHHSQSDTSQKILLEIPAFFRFGASDTTKEKDERAWTTIRGLFGPVLNVVTAAPLISVGRIAQPHIYIVSQKSWRNKFEKANYDPAPGSRAFVLLDGKWTAGKYLGPVIQKDENGDECYREVKTALKDDKDQWIIEQKPITVTGLHRIEIEGTEHEIPSTWCLLDRVYDRAIIQFQERNELIVKWAKFYSDKGLPTIIVCTRTLHVYILESMLIEVINPELVDILIGKDTPKERDACFDWFRKTSGSVLVTPLVREGVSINEIKAMVVADYVADNEVMRQILGRAMRRKVKGENRAYITLFREAQHPALRRGFNRMMRQLELEESLTFEDPAPNLDQLQLKLGNV